MLEQICAFIHNFFTHKDGEPYGRHAGTFTITSGELEVEGLLDGQYFRIIGSRMNDGVYQYPATGLTDETFTGEIYEMCPPRLFLGLVADIEAWQTKYGDAISGPYQSESFGGYSYSKATSTTESGAAVPFGWQTQFKPYLNQWRKLS